MSSVVDKNTVQISSFTEVAMYTTYNGMTLNSYLSFVTASTGGSTFAP